MFIAMNRFRIGAGHEEAFERRWRERNSRLDDVPGFERFWLLRTGAPSPGGHGAAPAAASEAPAGAEFISMSQWQTRGAFSAWTESDAFRQAHSSGGPPPSGMYLGAPQFTGYEVALSQIAGEPSAARAGAP